MVEQIFLYALESIHQSPVRACHALVKLLLSALGRKAFVIHVPNVDQECRAVAIQLRMAECSELDIEGVAVGVLVVVGVFVTLRHPVVHGVPIAVYVALVVGCAFCVFV